MDMSSMSMGPSATMSMSGMSMPSATSSASGMSHGMGMGMMGMDQMEMVFFTAHTTPLYSSAWTPRTIGQYVGTCFFLIILSFIFRGLIALRCNFHSLFSGAARFRDTALLHADDQIEKSVPRRWTVNEAVARAVLDTILAGVSYLLMLAVMTMNVGYFLSVLGGTFLGSFVLGGWTGTAAH